MGTCHSSRFHRRWSLSPQVEVKKKTPSGVLAILSHPSATLRAAAIQTAVPCKMTFYAVQCCRNSTNVNGQLHNTRSVPGSQRSSRAQGKGCHADNFKGSVCTNPQATYNTQKLFLNGEVGVCHPHTMWQIKHCNTEQFMFVCFCVAWSRSNVSWCSSR